MSRSASRIKDLSESPVFHTCAGSFVPAVPYGFAVGASACRRPCINYRLSGRMHCKVEGMESKGLRVNTQKTKIMVAGPRLDLLRGTGAFPMCCLSQK